MAILKVELFMAVISWNSIRMQGHANSVLIKHKGGTEAARARCFTLQGGTVDRLYCIEMGRNEGKGSPWKRSYQDLEVDNDTTQDDPLSTTEAGHSGQ